MKGAIKMENSMHKRKVTNLKVSIAAVAVVVGLVSGGYALGDGRVFNTQSAGAATVSTTAKATPVDTTPVNTDSAMVESAVDYYLAQKGVTAGSNKIVQLQIDSAWARGKLVNGDSGSVFYAHNVQGNWTVVFGGQTPLDSATAQQYGFPSSWVNQVSWYN